MARASGATIDETAQGGGAGDRLVGFEFGYTAGDAHGQVEAKLEGSGPDAKKQEQNYKLSLRIQEWLR